MTIKLSTIKKGNKNSKYSNKNSYSIFQKQKRASLRLTNN